MFLFLTALFMGAFERSTMLFIIIVVMGYGALRLVGMAIPAQKGG